jgi:hypothetical protein
MDFRLECIPQPSQNKIGIGQKIMLLGSCFTDHIYSRLHHYKFSALQNPSGTLFNPISIFKALHYYIQQKGVQEQDLVWQHGLWNHWDFHSSLSNPSKEKTLTQINQQITAAHEFIQQAEYLIITLGSGFVYEIDGSRIVANCHKFPAAVFRKRLLEPEEIIASFEETIQLLLEFNPRINLIFTISPVRHLRDGFVENNRSKAVLFHTLTKITSLGYPVFYFPAYELIVDDLRDYRFYAEDMVHPNYQATRYVWEKFAESCIDGKTREFMKELDQLLQAMRHAVQHPGSEEHMKFKSKFYALALQLSQRFTSINFTQELEYFKNDLR